MVLFWVNGVQTPVIIDDYIPVTMSGKPAFASCKNGEIWVSLLEKAWAKLHGTYLRTQGGLPCFAANHIMGVPGKSVHNNSKTKEQFFDLLMRSDQRNFTMIAASQG